MSVITLISDIGLQDYLVGAIKGRLMQWCPGYALVDIAHDIAPFNAPQAAYLCKGAYPHFPEGTFHIILVNLFDSRTDEFLLAWHDGHYFCCADNGLLTMIIGGKPELLIRLRTAPGQPVNTMQVIHLFAQAISSLSRGIAIDKLGEVSDALVEKNSLQPLISEDWMEGQIIYIDHFENVVVNITRQQFEQQRKGRDFRIFVKRDEYISHISSTYADVPEGNRLALFNTAGYLEIAINKGNAAGLFGLQSYHKEQAGLGGYNQSRLFYQTIRIHFG